MGIWVKEFEIIYSFKYVIFKNFLFYFFSKLFSNSIIDTDSLMIGLGEKNLDELVNPGMEAEWAQEKKKWFADTSPEQSKEPGLLKFRIKHFLSKR